MKYLGGKNKIGKYIAEVIKSYVPPEKMDIYLEPFCGSLGVMKNMTEYKEIYASDIHPDLISLWKKVKNGKFKAPKTLTEERWLKIKNYKSPNALKAFVGFGCSFGGKFFSAYAQKYTNGKNENYLQAATNSINKLEPKIKNINFDCCSYKDWEPNNILIYCDHHINLINFQ